MPLPLLFIGIAVSTGLYGTGKTAKAVYDNSVANKINNISNEAVKKATERLEHQRGAVENSLENLGKIKVEVLDQSINSFLDSFEQIKNVDFTNSVGLEELKNLHIDKKEFEELRQLGNFAAEVAGSVTAGAVGGAFTAFGAWSAASTLASASTGTAIKALSGIAAKNATLAFFGGGSLATGGLGMAGGTIVLGGLVAGPALLVMGLIVGAKTEEKLDKALANKAQSEEIVEGLSVASYQCSAIRRRTDMFYNLMAHIDTYFVPQIWKMEEIIKNEGTDYRLYTPESKKAIAMCASTACTIKSILDTPILSENGDLTVESEQLTVKLKEIIYK